MVLSACVDGSSDPVDRRRPNNTGGINTEYNIIRIIPNTRRFRQYYSALPQTTLGVFFVLFLALALYYVLYVLYLYFL